MVIMNDCRVKPVCVCVCTPQRCPTFCYSLVCSPPGSFFHGIFQARILELPYPAPGDLSDWDRTLSPALVGRFFFFFPFIFISWRLITLQYCSGFCHTLTWISHGFTCVPHPDPPGKSKQYTEIVEVKKSW